MKKVIIIASVASVAMCVVTAIVATKLAKRPPSIVYGPEEV